MDFLRTCLEPVKADPSLLLLDIGANVGGHTWLMRQHCPGHEIHCFEPIPALYEGLVRRYLDDPNIQVYLMGVSDQVGEIPGVAVHEAWTLVPPAEAKRGRNALSLERDGEGTFDMLTTTVDAFLSGGTDENDGLRCGFLKIDTDGYEARVLRGADQTLRRDRPTLLIEFGYLISDLGDSIEAMLDHIGDLNYAVFNGAGQRLWLADWRAWYPCETTWDVALLPVERLAEIQLLD